MTIEAKGRLPHQHHLPSLREILREMNQHRTSLISATVLTLGGIYGLHSVITGSAGNNDTGNSTKPGAAAPEPEPENGLGVTLVPTSAATSIPPEPTAAAVIEPTKVPTTIKPVEIMPIAEVPNKLDALVAAVNALPQSFDTRIKAEQFSSNKKEVEIAANEIKELLAKGDIAGALKKLSGGPYTLKEKIINLGGSPESKFVPQEIKDKYDPQDLVIKKDRVDPRTFPYYLPVVEIHLGLSIYSAK